MHCTGMLEVPILLQELSLSWSRAQPQSLAVSEFEDVENLFLVIFWACWLRASAGSGYDGAQRSRISCIGKFWYIGAMHVDSQ